jgi:hypothetical protein
VQIHRLVFEDREIHATTQINKKTQIHATTQINKKHKSMQLHRSIKTQIHATTQINKNTNPCNYTYQ